MRCLSGCVKRILVSLLRASQPLVAGVPPQDHLPRRSHGTVAWVRRVFLPRLRAMALLGPAANMAMERRQRRAMEWAVCRRASRSCRLHTGRYRRPVHSPARSTLGRPPAPSSMSPRYPTGCARLAPNRVVCLPTRISNRHKPRPRINRCPVAPVPATVAIKHKDISRRHSLCRSHHLTRFHPLIAPEHSSPRRSHRVAWRPNRCWTQGRSRTGLAANLDPQRRADMGAVAQHRLAAWRLNRW